MMKCTSIIVAIQLISVATAMATKSSSSSPPPLSTKTTPPPSTNTDNKKLNDRSSNVARARSIDSDEESRITTTITKEYKYNVRCPRPEDIHPCTCQEFNKGMEMEFQDMDESFDALDETLLEQATSSITTTNDTVIIEDKITITKKKIGRESRELVDEKEKMPHPDTIETLVFCKYISHEQVLMDALKGFNGHRVDHLIIDSCTLPDFPNKLFTNIHILWMQILNTTIHFEESFLQCAKDCL